MNPQNVSPQAMHMAMTMMALMPVFLLIWVAVIIIPCWMIWKKAGFSPWFSLLMLVPLVNLVMLYVLAFAQWKIVPAPTSQPAYYGGGAPPR